jgi:hypothetical protein
MTLQANDQFSSCCSHLFWDDLLAGMSWKTWGLRRSGSLFNKVWRKTHTLRLLLRFTFSHKVDRLEKINLILTKTLVTGATPHNPAPLFEIPTLE